MTPETDHSPVAESAGKILELLDQRGHLADSRIALAVMVTVLVRIVMMSPAPLRVMKGVQDVLHGNVAKELARGRK